MAFFGCSSLQSITIPSSVTEIGNWILRECNLKEIHMRHNDPKSIKIDEKLYIITIIDPYEPIDYDICTLYVPLGSQEKYLYHPIFGKFKNIEMETPNQIHEIEKCTSFCRDA